MVVKFGILFSEQGKEGKNKQNGERKEERKGDKRGEEGKEEKLLFGRETMEGAFLLGPFGKHSLPFSCLPLSKLFTSFPHIYQRVKC